MVEIEFKYRVGTKFSEEEIRFLENEAAKYGDVRVETYSSRAGALDLVSIIDVAIRIIAKEYLTNLSIRFINTGLKKIGDTLEPEITNMINRIRGLVGGYYSVFIKDKPNQQEAFPIMIKIGDVSLYATLNHYYANDELIENLAQAIVQVYGLISLGHIEVESKTCQLYPDFENNEWRHLFIPSYSAFGSYVDRYYDLKLKKVFSINSKEEFLKKFDFVQEDKFKLIINPLIDKR